MSVCVCAHAHMCQKKYKPPRDFSSKVVFTPRLENLLCIIQMANIYFYTLFLMPKITLKSF